MLVFRGVCFQENYNTPIEHTRSANPRSSTMKGIPKNGLLVKVARGVFQRCVETTFECWKFWFVNGIPSQFLMTPVFFFELLMTEWCWKANRKIPPNNQYTVYRTNRTLSIAIPTSLCHHMPSQYPSPSPDLCHHKVSITMRSFAMQNAIATPLTQQGRWQLTRYANNGAEWLKQPLIPFSGSMEAHILGKTKLVRMIFCWSVGCE